MVKYQVIYADPPWYYNERNHRTKTFGMGIWGHYKPMKDEDLIALPVGRLAADDSLLFLWATMPRLPFALKVMEQWDFTFKTVAFTWIKTNKNNNKPFFGVGYFSKSNAELCLLGTRGKVFKPAVNTVSSVIISPRREHSRKPDEAIQRIEQMYPNLSKIELFARQKAEGWDAIGHDIDGKDIREVLPCMISLSQAVWDSKDHI